MEVRLRAAAAPRTRQARDARATSRSRARARGTRSRTHHRPPIARPAAKHCTLQSAPRTASHTIHARTHPPPAFGWRHPASVGEIRKDTKGYARSHGIAGRQQPQLSMKLSMTQHVPDLAPLGHRKHAEHQEQKHLLLLGAASDNHGLSSGHSTRPEPQMGRANEQQRATP